MPSIARTIIPVVAFATVVAASSKSCPADSPISCHNSTAVQDTCCFIPTGQLLQTQFWDSSPPTGPSNSWTIHGLWPDNCDGSYPAHCDTDRAYNNIADILTNNGAQDTLDYMKKYWKDYQGNDDTFWEHEWGKHGTCISTLEPSCYSNYKATEEAAAFFTRTVNLFKTLPTYDWLAAAGITPSSSKTYNTDAVQSALEKKHGAKVTLVCKGKVLNEVWYHFNVKGSLQTGKFVAAQPDGAKGKCPSTIQYKPKSP